MKNVFNCFYSMLIIIVRMESMRLRKVMMMSLIINKTIIIFQKILTKTLIIKIK